MEYIKGFFNIILHVDKYLDQIIRNYGLFTYLILFTVIFCETGLVVIPFLPGDSLIFAGGAFAAKGSFNVFVFYLIVTVAAVLGDTVNYHIGQYFGPKIFEREHIRFLNKKNLEKTRRFYEKHGGVTIIIARFMPIIRTFAPFVAGIGDMTYLKFLSYNIIGGISWTALFTFAGFFFGGIPFVKNHFTTVIYAIIIISVIPALIAYLKGKFGKKKENA